MLSNCGIGKTLESPMDCKETQPVNPKGNQSWIFIGRTDAEAETPIFWSPNPKNWLNWKDPDAGKDWRQEEKGMTADEMAGWHHRLDGHEFEQAPGVGDGQGRLVCCSPWGHKELDTTEQLDWTELIRSWEDGFHVQAAKRKTRGCPRTSLLSVRFPRNAWWEAGECGGVRIRHETINLMVGKAWLPTRMSLYSFTPLRVLPVRERSSLGLQPLSCHTSY